MRPSPKQLSESARDRSNVRKVDIRLPGNGNSNSNGARLVCQNHLDDSVESDHDIVNKYVSLSPLSSELGTKTPVNARFWPWLAPCSVREDLEHRFKLPPLPIAGE
jgi:hypothetical protein